MEADVYVFMDVWGHNKPTLCNEAYSPHRVMSANADTKRLQVAQCVAGQTLRHAALSEGMGSVTLG